MPDSVMLESVLLFLPLCWLKPSVENRTPSGSPTEVHKVQVAKAFLKGVTPAPGMFPTAHIRTRFEAVKHTYAKELNNV